MWNIPSCTTGFIHVGWFSRWISEASKVWHIPSSSTTTTTNNNNHLGLVTNSLIYPQYYIPSTINHHHHHHHHHQNPTSSPNRCASPIPKKKRRSWCQRGVLERRGWWRIGRLPLRCRGELFCFNGLVSKKNPSQTAREHTTPRVPQKYEEWKDFIISYLRVWGMFSRGLLELS